MVVGRVMVALVKEKIIAVAILGRPNHVTAGGWSPDHGVLVINQEQAASLAAKEQQQGCGPGHGVLLVARVTASSL